MKHPFRLSIIPTRLQLAKHRDRSAGGNRTGITDWDRSCSILFLPSPGCIEDPLMYHHPRSQNKTEDFTRRGIGTMIPRAVLYVRKKTNELLQGKKKKKTTAQLISRLQNPPPITSTSPPSVAINSRHKPAPPGLSFFLSFHLTKFAKVR